MRIIFLDIDGVICTMRSHLAFGDKGGLMEAFDITSCQLIRRLCKCYGYQIVVSSTWRKHKRQLLSVYFGVYGLTEHIYKFLDLMRIEGDSDEWRTPVLPYVEGKTRGLEIQDWLSKHPDVENYLILDDDSDFLDHQKPFHVRTDCDEGFGAKDFIKCVELITAPKDTNA